MKKISILLVSIMSVIMLATPVLAVPEAQSSGEYSYSELEDRPGNASSTTIPKIDSKEEEIQEYTEAIRRRSYKWNSVVLSNISSKV